tara:strand:- start:78 stop:443 length:366 start_codon:yes stop_codon:yes gene_type:complete
MSEKSQNTLVRGMFIREYISKKGTSIFNVAINTVNLTRFIKDNYNKDRNGNLWTNIKIVPNKETTENGLTHTPLLDNYYFRDEETEIKKLASEVLEEEVDDKIVEKEQATIEAEKQEDLPF